MKLSFFNKIENKIFKISFSFMVKLEAPSIDRTAVLNKILKLSKIWQLTIN